jgi:hypothetical protein
MQTKQTMHQIMLRDLKLLRYWWSCLACSVTFCWFALHETLILLSFCVFICERSELFMVKNVYLGFFNKFNLLQSSHSGASYDNNHANGDISMQIGTDDHFSVLSKNLCLVTKNSGPIKVAILNFKMESFE